MARPIGKPRIEALSVLEDRLLTVLCAADPKHGITTFNKNPFSHENHDTHEVVL